MKKHSESTDLPKSLTQRIEAFTDGVFAIVITLLVLELRIPEVHGPHLSEQLREGLVELVPKFISFVVSFLYVSIYWYNHHQLFHPVKSLNRALFWHNSIFLLFLTFIPFPTALIGSYPEDKVAVTCYGLAMMATAVSFVLMKIYIKYSGKVMKAVALTKTDIFYLSAGPLLYVVAIVAGLIDVNVALAIYILVPIIYFFAGTSENHPT